MSTPNASTGLAFETLPFEIIEQILLCLDPRDIATCQRASRHFMDIIQRSVALQYKIECHLARAVDNPFVRDPVLLDRLENMRKWRKAYQTCTWTGHIAGDVISTSSEICIRAFGAAYVEMIGKTIRVTQPASTFRGRKEREWVLQDVGFEPKAYSYDHSERILALIDQIDDNHYEIHLVSPETGGTHLSATAPSISVSVEPIDFAADLYNASCDVEVYGSSLCVMVSREFKRGYIDILVYDWKSGDILLNMCTESYHDAEASFAFLDEAHVILPVFEELSAGEVLGSEGFVVVQIRPGNSERRSWGEAIEDESSLFLKLPEKSNQDAHSRDALSVWGRPIPPSNSAALSDDAFVRDPNDSMVGMAFRATERVGPDKKEFVTNYFNIMVPSAAVLSLLSSPSQNHSSHHEPRSVPWSDWGRFAQLLPAGCTWRMDPLTYSLHGSRYLYWDSNESETSDMFFWDFDIPGVLRKIHEDNAKQAIETDPSQPPMQTNSLLSHHRVPCYVLVTPSADVEFGDDFVVVLHYRVAGWNTYKKDVYWI